MAAFEDDLKQWTTLFEDDSGEHATDATTTYADLSLGPAKDVADLSHFYPAELIMQSRLVEDTGASRPMQELFSHIDSATPPFPLMQSTPFCPHGASAMEPHQSLSSGGLGMIDLWPPACSGPCAGPSKGHTWVHQLLAAAAWDEAATEAGYRGSDSYDDAQSGSEVHSAAVDHPFESSTVPPQAAHQGFSSVTNHLLPLDPSPTRYSSLRGPFLASARPGPANDLHLPLPPTPPSPTYLTTPGSSGASTRSSPGRISVAVPIPSSQTQRRRQRSAPYARPSTSHQQPNPGSSMDPTDTTAIDNARNGVRKFVMDNPRVIEPNIGDPAAITIVGSGHRLGTPGKSLYSIFFLSSRSGNTRFNCRDCGHVDVRFSRAVRHQRQEHFGHYPYLCQGGVGHPACGQWFASDEYAKDHVTKAGPTTFPCPDCSKVFPNVGNLGRHRKKIHNT